MITKNFIDVRSKNLPFIPSDIFTGKKEGYVFKNIDGLGLRYHKDNYTSNARMSEECVPLTSLLLQNMKDKFEPDSSFCDIGTLADPGHRCHNFGKEM